MSYLTRRGGWASTQARPRELTLAAEGQTGDGQLRGGGSEPHLERWAFWEGNLALGSRAAIVKGNEGELNPGLWGTRYDLEEQKLEPSLESRGSSLEWGSSSKIPLQESPGAVIWGSSQFASLRTSIPSSTGK